VIVTDRLDFFGFLQDRTKGHERDTLPFVAVVASWGALGEQQRTQLRPDAVVRLL